MSLFEKLNDNKITDSEFVKLAAFALAEITGKAVTHKTKIMVSRLFKLYGRKGVLSALYTLDTAVMSDNFSLRENIYPFLVYGAKKVFEANASQYQNLNEIVEELRRANGT